MSLGDLTTEGRNPASEEIDRLSALEIVRVMNREDARVAEAVERIAGDVAQAIDVIAGRLAAGGRLIYIGAGTSGRLGVLDASECPPTFNSPPWQVVGLIAGGRTALTRAVEGAEDHPELAVTDLQRIGFSAEDVLVGIATSGRTPYVIGGLRHAREIGAYTIGLSCNEDAELNLVSDLILAPVVGPEIVSGSTRLKAGTATKLVLNMLTTGAMVRLGKTYGNLMVDLQATNSKLADRSGRIVAALTGLPRDEADRLLAECGGDVKTSFVVHRRGVDPAVGRRLLELAGGRLRDALEMDLPTVDSPSKSSTLLLVGVDGGGSKTLAWLADLDSATAEPRGVGEAGPANPHAAGWHAAVGNIDRAIDKAFLAAGLPRESAAGACLAVAGTGRDADRQRLETWARQRRIAERIVVTHDADPVLAAGTSGGVGVAIIAGTGSLAFGRNAAGATARAGGWGAVVSDEGSGYAIARAGLAAVVRAHDGRGPATELMSTMLEALECRSPMDLRTIISREEFDARRLASLAPLVLSAAEAGDQVAGTIVEAAARELAGLVPSVAQRLDFESGIELAVTGGVLVHSRLLRERMLEEIAAAGLNVARVGVVETSVRGAIRIARGMVAERGQ
jgi:N-acetylmuramic acid 6-phosphate etherase